MALRLSGPVMDFAPSLAPSLRTVLRRAFLALAALVCATQPAHAEKVQATGQSTAVVVAPLTLIANQAMNFGLIAPSPSGGTVVMNADTVVCTTTGGIVRTGTCQPAEFTGMGVRRMTLRISIPTSVTLNGPAGRTMTVSNLTLDITPDLRFMGGNGNGLGNGNRRYEIQPTNSIFDFRVGGTLNVGANQSGGVYRGTFPVTVQYQ